MTKLSDLKCVPCKGGIPPLTHEQIEPLKAQLSPQWQLPNDHHLERNFKFPDFKSALAFTVAVGNLAESEGHHPDINLSWGKVKVTIWTHKINGLTESDFILASKIDALAS